MISVRSFRVREKRFRPARRSQSAGRKRDRRGAVTLTDDHSLFLVHRLREQRDRIEHRPWWKRLFRRR